MRWLPVLIAVACAGAKPRICNAPEACRAACDGGTGDACVRLMWMTPPDTAPDDLQEIRAVVDRACERGVARACALVAHTWCEIDAGGIGGCKKAAIDRFRAACLAGDGFGCEGLAAVYQRGGEGIEPDAGQVTAYVVLAGRAFSEACDRGSLYDCIEAAQPERARRVRHHARWKTEAFAMAARACDDGDALACMVLHRRGEPGRAARACKLGLASACSP